MYKNNCVIYVRGGVNDRPFELQFQVIGDQWLGKFSLKNTPRQTLGELVEAFSQTVDLYRENLKSLKRPVVNH